MGIDVALTGRPQSDKWEIAKLGTNTHAGTSISAGYADTVTISHNLGYHLKYFCLRLPLNNNLLLENP